MLLFILSAFVKLTTVAQPNSLVQIFAAITSLAAAGLLTKKALRKYKRKMLFTIIKQRLQNTFKQKSSGDKLFGLNKLAVIITGLALLIILLLLTSVFTAVAVVGMLFLMAWVYTTYIAPKQED